MSYFAGLIKKQVSSKKTIDLFLWEIVKVNTVHNYFYSYYSLKLAFGLINTDSIIKVIFNQFLMKKLVY